MDGNGLALNAAPIVEAVVDIDCDMPPRPDVEALDAAGSSALLDAYPNPRRRLGSEQQVSEEPGKGLAVTIRSGLLALQYVAADDKQIVQFRPGGNSPGGYSFNRLAPYTRLDDYLGEIERTWKLFVGIAHPVIVKSVRLRYINRISLPLTSGRVRFGDYLKLGPKLPDEQQLTFVGFFNQHSVAEPATGNTANIVFATQPSEAGHLPLIFDIEALRVEDAEPGDWLSISARIASLRSLKNRIFKNSLTEQCLNLFRH